MLAGRFNGSTQLGYYSKIYILTILSDYQNSKEILYKKYMSILRLLLIVGICAEIIVFFSTSEIIDIIYGSN